MRLICEFGFDGILTLPIHYNHLLQGFIYKNLTDDALRTFLHEVGFQKGKRSYKLFTYSRILGKSRFNQKKNDFFYSLYDYISLLSSMNLSRIRAILFQIQLSVFRRKEVELRSIMVKEFSLKEPKIEIRMLSPLVTYPLQK